MNSAVNMLRGGDSVISLQMNVPFVCKSDSECMLEITVYDPEEKYDCLDATIAVKSEDTCGVKIKGMVTSQNTVFEKKMINIIITTKNNNNYSLKDKFWIMLLANVHGSGFSFFKGEFRESISVFIRDDAFWQGNYCYANNDPRMRTFDGIYYSNDEVDEFVMFRHKRLPVEVQMKTMSCNNGWAACSCGVTVRAGGDVYTIQHCDGTHLTGYLQADDGILIVRRRTENRYQIYLPHGTLVDVHVSPWRWYMVNINIYPSPADVGHSEGLCGNFNGDRDDDLTHRDGTIAQISWWWYFYPNDFTRSWGLNYGGRWDEESLLNPDRPVNTSSGWSKEEQLCICPSSPNRTEALCSPNEDQTCTSSISRPGISVDINSRQKRSAGTIDRNIPQRLLKMRQQREKRQLIKRSQTQVTLTEEEAVTLCSQRMASECPLYTLKNETNTDIGNAEELVKDCARDLAINPDLDWSEESCTRYQAIVETELAKDIVFQEENREIFQKISDVNRCIGNCSGNGICVGEDVCECNEGFSAGDCSLDLTIPPEIQITYSNATCDLRTNKGCECIPLITSGNLQTTVCNVSVFTADVNGEFIEESTFTTAAEYENYNELYCCHEEGHRRRRSVEGSSLFAQRIDLAVSNDGIHFGNVKFVYVLDSTCQEVVEIDGQRIIVLKAGYCFIKGTCYEKGTVELGCKVCSPDTDVFEWTSDSTCQRDESSTSPTSAGGVLTGVMTGIAIGFGLLLFGLILLVGIVIAKKISKRKVEPDHEMPVMQVQATKAPKSMSEYKGY